MEEEWRDIKGYENLYQVSNLGRVKSLNYKHTGKTQVLKQMFNNCGYTRVNLYKQGKVKTCAVHRLVAQAFIPNPLNLPEVNHKDEIKTNNCLWNLEWCDKEYNMNYGSRNERVSKANKGKHRSEETKAKLSKAHCKPVICLELKRVFDSIKAVAEYLDCTRSNVANCTRNEHKCKGYTLKFIEIEVL